MGEAWSTYWAPVVNLARSPRWGRNLECAGEDPYLSGVSAAYRCRLRRYTFHSLQLLLIEQGVDVIKLLPLQCDLVMPIVR